MELNPFRALRRRARLSRAAKDEADRFRMRFNDGAYEAAVQAAERSDLTSWGRAVMRAAAEELRPRTASKSQDKTAAPKGAGKPQAG